MLLRNISLIDQLKQAREQSGLSQRELTSMTGVQQAQLSKIERGAVDPRVTTLVAISRALDLELVLVPRTSLPTVHALLKGVSAIVPAYTLDGESDESFS